MARCAVPDVRLERDASWLAWLVRRRCVCLELSVCPDRFYMEPLDELLALIEANSHAAASLVLFALVKTLSTQQGQYLFLLNKLKDLNAEQRQLAYRLMEAMVEGANNKPEWHAKIAAMEAVIRQA